DYDGNGSEIFDLLSTVDEIRNGQEEIQISFHNSLADATIGENAINNSDSYNSEGEILWIRAENDKGCFSVTNLELVVIELPQLNQPSIYEMCSEDSDTAVFNLNSKNFEMSAGQPYSFSYYETLADAQSGINEIPNPASYTNISNPQVIYVRAENQQGCFVTTQFDLIVSVYPDAFQPLAYEVCDDNNDGYALFDLTSLIDEITGGVSNVSITFHETQDDALFNANIIPNPEAYFNIAEGSQTMYIAVNSLEGACRVFTSVDLIVHPKPSSTKTIYPLEVCDDDYDGSAEFNLTDALSDIMNGLDLSLHTISYHPTQNDARLDEYAIGNFANYDSASGSFWVRVDDDQTGCFDVVELALVVNPLPVVSLD